MLRALAWSTPLMPSGARWSDNSTTACSSSSLRSRSTFSWPAGSGNGCDFRSCAPRRDRARRARCARGAAPAGSRALPAPPRRGRTRCRAPIRRSGRGHRDPRRGGSAPGRSAGTRGHRLLLLLGGDPKRRPARRHRGEGEDLGRVEEDALVFEIADDGCGFARRTAVERRPAPNRRPRCRSWGAIGDRVGARARYERLGTAPPDRRD